MTPYQIVLISLVIIAFLFSIFFCASEIAFSTISRLKVRLWSKNGKAGAKTIEKMVNDPESFLIPILIGNNIANVLYASTIAYLIIELDITRFSSFEVTIYITLVLVLFAEILPKILVRNTVEKSIFILIFPFTAIYYLLMPISFFIKQISRPLMKLFGVDIASSEPLLVTKKDIEGVIEEVSLSDNFAEDEKELIGNVLDLKESKISEIGTHRNSIIGIDRNSSLVQLKKLFGTTGYSKIIVYDDNIDNITGVVYVKDLFRNPVSLAGITKELRFIPANISQYSLLQQFKEEQVTIAAIIDEFGGCSGIVTMQDILNEIVGTVSNRHRVKNIKSGITYRKKKNILIVNGEVAIDDLNDKIEEITGSNDYSIKEDKYVTINGFLINQLHRIPLKGERYNYNNLEYKIMNSSKNKILNVILDFNKIKS